MTIDDDLDATATAASTTEEAHYRYPGSPPFADTDLDRRLFRGRSDEADTVLHSILAHSLFVLYGASGLGKSSLLNAGVMQPLRDRGYWPVAARFNDPSDSPVDRLREQVELAGAAADDVDVSIDHADADGAPRHLWDVIGSLEVWRGNELQQPVIVLDQFEELFTLDWDESVRQRFISEFGEVVRGHADPDGRVETPGLAPDVRFVIVIREDALGLLDELATDVPQIMRHRFRLGPLDPDRAEAAIREPGLVVDDRLDSERFVYTEAAAREILDFLRSTSEDGRTRLSRGVDPSQLQIVCQYVERAIVPRKRTSAGEGDVVEIDVDDLGGRAGLDRILSEFYRRTVDSLDSSSTERRVRHLCERGLISKSERRLSLEEQSIVADFGVGETTLERLVDLRLLRAEPRVGSVYYELAHDTLVPAILADRARRLAVRARRSWIAAAAVAAVVIATVALVVSSRFGDDGPATVTVGDGTARVEASTVEVRGTIAEIAATEAADTALVVRVANPSTPIVLSIDGDGDRTVSDRTRPEVASSDAGTELVPTEVPNPIDPFVAQVPARDAAVTVTPDGGGVARFDVEAIEAPVVTLEGPCGEACSTNGTIQPTGSPSPSRPVHVFRLPDGATHVVDVIPDDELDVAVVGFWGPNDERSGVVNSNGTGSAERLVRAPGANRLIAVVGAGGTSGEFELRVTEAPLVESNTSAEFTFGNEADAAYVSIEDPAGLSLFTPGLTVELVSGPRSGRPAGFAPELFVVEPGDGRAIVRLRTAPGLFPESTDGAQRTVVVDAAPYPAEIELGDDPITIDGSFAVFDVACCDDGEPLELAVSTPAFETWIVRDRGFDGMRITQGDDEISLVVAKPDVQPQRIVIGPVDPGRSEVTLRRLTLLEGGDERATTSESTVAYMLLDGDQVAEVTARNDSGDDGSTISMFIAEVGRYDESEVDPTVQDPIDTSETDVPPPEFVDGTSRRAVTRLVGCTRIEAARLFRIEVLAPGPAVIGRGDGVERDACEPVEPTDGLITPFVAALLVDAGATPQQAACTNRTWLEPGGNLELTLVARLLDDPEDIAALQPLADAALACGIDQGTIQAAAAAAVEAIAPS